LLDDFDHENLDNKGLTTRKANHPRLADYQNVISSMRSEFESGVFGKEKDGSFKSAISQIGRGFGRGLLPHPGRRSCHPSLTNCEKPWFR
jgi:hypothetical protein